jgi:tungstate transport system ATP-binding protein
MLDSAAAEPNSVDAMTACSAKSVLACRDLRFETDGQRLLRDISVAFAASGISVVMGPNGAGKSLFLRLLHGLIPPTSGSVSCNDGPVTSADRARQSMVFQKPVLMRRSVGKNVDFVLRSRGRADPVLRNTLLARVALQERVRQPARLLSGGEQQRLALARGPRVPTFCFWTNRRQASIPHRQR